MAKKRVPKDIDAIIAEIEGANDRATIIVGASLVDEILERAIGERLPPLSGEDMERILADGGLLGTFSAKIMWAYTTGMIGPKTRHTLNVIRRIRNDAAHSSNPVLFSTSPIKGRALAIEGGDAKSEKNPRERFVQAVRRVVMALIDQILAIEDQQELAATLKE